MIGPADDLLDICGDFFDQIDDLLDFPTGEMEGEVIGGDCNAFWTAPPPDTLMGGPNAVFSGNNDSSRSELANELSVPYEDIAQLEWLSNFVEDSFSAGSSITIDKDSSTNDQNSYQFQTSSPVSVLESSSSSSGSGGRTMPLSPETIVPGRARSKRPRPATFNPRPVIPLISPTSSVTDPSPSFSASELASEFENHAESRPWKKVPRSEMLGQKKKKLSPAPGAKEQYAPAQPVAVRKCLHCEITKTPQWRAGPMGPKTLCNACGVRYKSGRLFPEYRPAASPTFVASLHSNSHKKVLEMRTQAGQKAEMAATGTPITDATELIPNSHLLDYI
ncbi:PREDICTED: GATA transcription factor 8-like [Nelumbo nucifera]|uniref:GATA transcription factor n=1 Tax=Nelumbo nucifera TaxID=4432 RepID=A0A1U8AB31_NELNU|nr:PREDICTED: GATA transcription factor 8-like [Nelumbo nucifera]